MHLRGGKVVSDRLAGIARHGVDLEKLSYHQNAESNKYNNKDKIHVC